MGYLRIIPLEEIQVCLSGQDFEEHLLKKPCWNTKWGRASGGLILSPKFRINLSLFSPVFGIGLFVWQVGRGPYTLFLVQYLATAENPLLNSFLYSLHLCCQRTGDKEVDKGSVRWCTYALIAVKSLSSPSQDIVIFPGAPDQQWNLYQNQPVSLAIEYLKFLAI